MPSSVKAILEFVSGERGPVSAHLVACELERFGRISSEWPQSTVEQWREVIEGAIAAGQLASDGKGNVSIPKRDEKPKPSKQGNLF